MIRLLLRLYPPAWRERYGDELDGLIDDTGVTPRVVVDVARGAAREWTGAARVALAGGGTMVLGPAWRHPTGWAVVAAVLMAPMALVAAISLVAYQLGVSALVPLQQSAIDWVAGLPRVIDLVLLLVPLLAALVAVIPLVRLELRRGDAGRELAVAVRLRWLNLVVGLIGFTLSGLLIWNVFAESVLGVN